MWTFNKKYDWGYTIVLSIIPYWLICIIFISFGLYSIYFILLYSIYFILLYSIQFDGIGLYDIIYSIWQDIIY
jgi:hypothetical protein